MIQKLIDEQRDTILNVHLKAPFRFCAPSSRRSGSCSPPSGSTRAGRLSSSVTTAGSSLSAGAISYRWTIRDVAVADLCDRSGDVSFCVKELLWGSRREISHR